MMSKSPAMKLLQNCLCELTIEFIKYCEKQGIQLREHYLLIRRNVSVNPISTLLITYNKVRAFQVSEETALFRNYLENEIMDYFMLGTSGPEAVQKNVRNKFFQMIIRKEKRRQERQKQEDKHAE